ncbi:MAG: [FeFe] hydrogenase H-cluster radical SAM maturase HydG [Deltaproteobacteria bacterium]|nr:[FeFe] hydrogenase H-cluster radical SAM maturase HydG [Deltaproteobacteria bacterium]
MIIDAKRIENILSDIKQPNAYEVDDILAKASLLNGLNLEDAAVLVSVEDPHILKTIFIRAGEVKEKVFGKRIVLFAPLYLSNYCINNCLYCGFRKGNKDAVRKALSIDEVMQEAKILEAKGFKRILLVCGEEPKVSSMEYIIEAVDAIYKTTGIRIIHVNSPPMDSVDLKRLKASGVGVYQVFQETYHRPTYALMHPSGKKRNYDYRLGVMDRAMEAGFEDVGIGSLLGLYDYKFDVLATLAHSQHLFKRFGAYAHTISVPRLRPADGSSVKDAPFSVSDLEFKKVVAVYRLAVPCAGVVVSTREAAVMRDEVIQIGASQISAGSKTEPGGYASVGTVSTVQPVEQFSTNDHRGLEEMIASIIRHGFMPSLCTTCYRVGRTGADFTGKTLSGNMEKFCQANALLTLQEYLLDYVQNGARELGESAIEKGLQEIKETGLKKEVLKKLDEIRQGKRDVFL